MRKILFSIPVLAIWGLCFPNLAMAGSKNILQIESDPVGTEVILRKQGSERKYKSCETPCQFNVKPNKAYDLVAAVPDGGYFDLPVEFPTERHFGGSDYLDVKVFFNLADPDLTSIGLLTEIEPERKYPPGEKPPLPIIRLPAHFPDNVEKSGHCNLTFDVTAKGRTTNLSATCTDEIFRSHSLESALKYRYRPQAVKTGDDYTYVYTEGMETKVVFRVTDENGEIIPE